MAAATAQGTYINPMAAIATQLPHATINGMANSALPPTSGNWCSSWIHSFAFSYISPFSLICPFPPILPFSSNFILPIRFHYFLSSLSSCFASFVSFLSIVQTSLSIALFLPICFIYCFFLLHFLLIPPSSVFHSCNSFSLPPISIFKFLHILFGYFISIVLTSPSWLLFLIFLFSFFSPYFPIFMSSFFQFVLIASYQNFLISSPFLFVLYPLLLILFLFPLLIHLHFFILSFVFTTSYLIF